MRWISRRFAAGFLAGSVSAGLAGILLGQASPLSSVRDGQAMIPAALGLAAAGALGWFGGWRTGRASGGLSATAPEVGSPALVKERCEDDRNRMLVALQEAHDAAVQANLSKTRFLAAASHDLRQPMQALGLFVATLAEKPLTEDLRHIVGRIEASLAAVEHLLDTLLDISRFDAGAVEAHPHLFAMQSLFDRLALEFVPLAENKGLSIHFVHTGTAVVSDPLLLERILRNLLSNALRYTTRGGIVVGCRRRGRMVRIEVWDSGKGIAPAHQQEIFREFHQLGGRQEERQGLGLGLSIVDRIATLLEHQIEVKSLLGKGSVFAVVAPGNNRRLRQDDPGTPAVTSSAEA